MTVQFTGDEIVPDASLVFDRRKEIAAPPAEVWPWLVQLGKGRSGWYFPFAVERFWPARRRATRSILPQFQTLTVGERVPDYGPDGYFDVALVDPPNAVVYRSERKGAFFSWALLLEPVAAGQTVVHLRFRGRIKSTGVKRALFVAGGGFFDWATSELMLRGLRDRVEARVEASRVQ